MTLTQAAEWAAAHRRDEAERDARRHLRKYLGSRKRRLLAAYLAGVPWHYVGQDLHATVEGFDLCFTKVYGYEKTWWEIQRRDWFMGGIGGIHHPADILKHDDD